MKAAEDEPDELDDAAETPAVRVTREAKEIKLGKKIKKDSQLNLRFAKSSEFEFPPLTLLAEPKRSTKQSIDLSDEALEQNARMLEGVLEDFGVKGQIINVKPGPGRHTLRTGACARHQVVARDQPCR